MATLVKAKAPIILANLANATVRAAAGVARRNGVRAWKEQYTNPDEQQRATAEGKWKSYYEGSLRKINRNPILRRGSKWLGPLSFGAGVVLNHAEGDSWGRATVKSAVSTAAGVAAGAVVGAGCAGVTAMWGSVLCAVAGVAVSELASAAADYAFDHPQDALHDVVQHAFPTVMSFL
ncbi:MAG: hypothetical protein ACJ74O_18990 [Frankiaceae bacterium]